MERQEHTNELQRILATVRLQAARMFAERLRQKSATTFDQFHEPVETVELYDIDETLKEWEAAYAIALGAKQ